jgi:hypothetical protein
MSDPEDIAIKHLIDLLEKREFKRKLVGKMNKNIDLPMFDERTEKKIMNTVYNEILEALQEINKKDN